MQIPDPFLSPVVAPSIPAQPQQNSRSPAKPVIIEGQLVEDKKQPTKEQTPDFTLPSFQQGSSNNTLSTQMGTVPEVLYSNKSLLANVQSANTQPDPSKADNNFPYGNRRSQQGLAGSSLVVQRYLNNEPANTMGTQQQGNIDLYI